MRGAGRRRGSAPERGGHSGRMSSPPGDDLAGLSGGLPIASRVRAHWRSVRRERTALQAPVGPSLEGLSEEPIRRSESVDVAPDELSLACRLSGLTIDELWMRYLEIGGSRSRSELQSRLGGAGWPEPDDCYLAVGGDEALRGRGLPRLPQPTVSLPAVVGTRPPAAGAPSGPRRAG